MNVNQFYSENIAEDITRGLIDNARQCNSNGSLPFGLKRGVDGRIVADETEAEIVAGIAFLPFCPASTGLPAEIGLKFQISTRNSP